MNDTLTGETRHTNDGIIEDDLLYEAPHDSLPDISYDTGGASAILFNSYWYRLWTPQHDYLHTEDREEWEAY